MYISIFLSFVLLWKIKLSPWIRSYIWYERKIMYNIQKGHKKICNMLKSTGNNKVYVFSIWKYNTLHVSRPCAFTYWHIRIHFWPELFAYCPHRYWWIYEKISPALGHGWLYFIFLRKAILWKIFLYFEFYVICRNCGTTTSIGILAMMHSTTYCKESTPLHAFGLWRNWGIKLRQDTTVTNPLDPNSQRWHK